MNTARGIPTDVAGRVITAQDTNRLLQRLGCTHRTARDGDLFGPLWCHIIDAHCDDVHDE